MFWTTILAKTQQPRSAVLIKERQTLGTQKQGDQPSPCVPDNVLFLEYRCMVFQPPTAFFTRFQKRFKIVINYLAIIYF